MYQLVIIKLNVQGRIYCILSIRVWVESGESMFNAIWTFFLFTFFTPVTNCYKQMTCTKYHIQNQCLAVLRWNGTIMHYIWLNEILWIIFLYDYLKIGLYLSISLNWAIFRYIEQYLSILSNIYQYWQNLSISSNISQYWQYLSILSEPNLQVLTHLLQYLSISQVIFYLATFSYFRLSPDISGYIWLSQASSKKYRISRCK